MPGEVQVLYLSFCDLPFGLGTRVHIRLFPFLDMKRRSSQLPRLGIANARPPLSSCALPSALYAGAGTQSPEVSSNHRA